MVSDRSRCRLHPLWMTSAVMVMAMTPAAIGLDHVLATPPDGQAAYREEHPAADPPARAYDRPLPTSARFQVVDLIVLDDQTSLPLGDVEVRIHNKVDWQTRAFRTDSRGRLRFEYPYLRGEPAGASNSGRMAMSRSTSVGASTAARRCPTR